jgi:hypothetical protein
LAKHPPGTCSPLCETCIELLEERYARDQAAERKRAIQERKRRQMRRAVKYVA